MEKVGLSEFHDSLNDINEYNSNISHLMLRIRHLSELSKLKDRHYDFYCNSRV